MKSLILFSAIMSTVTSLNAQVMNCEVITENLKKWTSSSSRVTVSLTEKGTSELDQEAVGSLKVGSTELQVIRISNPAATLNSLKLVSQGKNLESISKDDISVIMRITDKQLRYTIECRH